MQEAMQHKQMPPIRWKRIYKIWLLFFSFLLCTIFSTLEHGYGDRGRHYCFAIVLSLRLNKTKGIRNNARKSKSKQKKKGRQISSNRSVLLPFAHRQCTARVCVCGLCDGLLYWSKITTPDMLMIRCRNKKKEGNLKIIHVIFFFFTRVGGKKRENSVCVCVCKRIDAISFGKHLYDNKNGIDIPLLFFWREPFKRIRKKTNRPSWCIKILWYVRVGGL